MESFQLKSALLVIISSTPGACVSGVLVGVRQHAHYVEVHFKFVLFSSSTHILIAFSSLSVLAVLLSILSTILWPCTAAFRQTAR